MKDVSDEADLLSLLAKGALSRTTGATAMNSVSSRSHAILQSTLSEPASWTGEMTGGNPCI